MLASAAYSSYAIVLHSKAGWASVITLNSNRPSWR
jgi:hypothetical protein